MQLRSQERSNIMLAFSARNKAHAKLYSLLAFYGVTAGMLSVSVGLNWIRDCGR